MTRVLLMAVALSACSDPGSPAASLPDGGAGDAAIVDAEVDSGRTREALCDDWCAALDAACGAGEADCAETCRARLPGLRGACPQSFRDFFECMLDAADWTCVGPGVARAVSCTDLVEAWQTCTR
jgi:hypothetical protein